VRSETTIRKTLLPYVTNAIEKFIAEKSRAKYELRTGRRVEARCEDAFHGQIQNRPDAGLDHKSRHPFNQRFRIIYL
jgi:hypothetical protein